MRGVTFASHPILSFSTLIYYAVHGGFSAPAVLGGGGAGVAPSGLELPACSLVLSVHFFFPGRVERGYPTFSIS